MFERPLTCLAETFGGGARTESWMDARNTVADSTGKRSRAFAFDPIFGARRLTRYAASSDATGFKLIPQQWATMRTATAEEVVVVFQPQRQAEGKIALL